MLHFVIGTKAQFIKMAPLMWLLEQQGRPYRLLDLSQHGALTGAIISDFGLKPPTTRFGEPDTLVQTYGQAAAWSLGLVGQSLRGREHVRARWFAGERGHALVHGDTASTLLGSLLARRAGQPLALVEAGLTSGKLLNPFPEEAIRRLVQRLATHCFCPGSKETAFLERVGGAARAHNIGYNTGHDALVLALSKPPRQGIRRGCAVATLHRLETLASRDALRRAVEHLRALCVGLEGMCFFMHPPTRNALKRDRLLDRLSQTPAMCVQELQPYGEFVHVLANAGCIITDGGSIQEEAASLGKPCLILRTVTERDAGVGDTARLTSWSVDDDLAFLRARQAQGRAILDRELSASRKILDVLLEDDHRLHG